MANSYQEFINLVIFMFLITKKIKGTSQLYANYILFHILLRWGKINKVFIQMNVSVSI